MSDIAAPALGSDGFNRCSWGGMEKHITALLDANIDFVRGLLFEGQLT